MTTLSVVIVVDWRAVLGNVRYRNWEASGQLSGSRPRRLATSWSAERWRLQWTRSSRVGPHLQLGRLYVVLPMGNVRLVHGLS